MSLMQLNHFFYEIHLQDLILIMFLTDQILIKIKNLGGILKFESKREFLI